MTTSSGVMYAIEPIVEAGLRSDGTLRKASGGRLRWARHIGHEDGTFRWQDFKTVGTGWGDFTHVFSGGNGIIYAIERVVEAGLRSDGTFRKASGGRLRWARHFGHEDGTFRWRDFETVGTGWSDFTHVFSGGNGIIYAIERVVEAGLNSDGSVREASGWRMRWARHLGHEDGSFRWEDFKIVGTGWGDFTHVFSGGNGVIYAIERVVEAGLNSDGTVRKASGGRLRWARHLGHEDGSFRWEDFKIVGTGWNDFTRVFAEEESRGGTVSHGRFCEFLDPPGTPQIGFRSYLLKPHGRGVPMTWSLSGYGTPSVATVNGVSAAQMLSTLNDAFNLWTAAVPALQFVFLPSGGGDIVIGVGDLGAANAAGNVMLGLTRDDGSTITLNNNVTVSFVPKLPGGNSLLGVAAHEIGHAIGILHSSTAGTLMFPFAGPEALATEDIAAAAALYDWGPQTEVTGIGTDSSPALCACGPWLVMAWKGIGADDRILFSRTLDGINWSAQSVVPNAGSADGPALAWDGSTLWLAIRGVQGDDGLYWATSKNLGDNWSSVEPIPNTGSQCSPSLSIAGGRPLLVWRGVPGDDGLYWSTWANPWAPQQQIAGAGSEDRPSVCLGFDNLPHAVWRGIPDDDSLYWSTLVGGTWQPQQQRSWVMTGNGAAGVIGTGVPGSRVGPGLANAGGRMLMAWQGVPDDDGIYFTQAAAGLGGSPAVEWSSQALVEGIGTSHRPAIALFKGTPFMAWKGVGDDHTIYTKRQL